MTGRKGSDPAGDLISVGHHGGSLFIILDLVNVKTRQYYLSAAEVTYGKMDGMKNLLLI